MVKKMSIIADHYVYKPIWIPVTGEELSVQHEDNNVHDKHAVAAIKDDCTVQHACHSISCAMVLCTALRPVGNLRPGTYLHLLSTSLHTVLIRGHFFLFEEGVY